jgi:hypothetical protein
MKDAVAPLAGAYDLTAAKAAIGTALSAGRAEVRLNYASSTAMLQAKDFDEKLRADLAAASSDDAVLELLSAAKTKTQGFQDVLAKSLEEILAEDVRKNTALADRVPEAEAAVKAIKKEVSGAFRVTRAGAELAAAGAQAALGLRGLESDLQRALKEASSNEAVDAALESAERRLTSETSSGNESLDGIIKAFGLASAEGAKRTGAEK